MLGQVPGPGRAEDHHQPGQRSVQVSHRPGHLVTYTTTITSITSITSIASITSFTSITSITLCIQD